MATPTVREVVTAHNSGADATATTGAGTQAGDVLLAIHVEDFLTLADMTAPTGTAGTWTEQTSVDLGTNNTHMKIWSRTVSSGGAQTVTVASHSGDEVLLHVYVLAGVNTVNDGTASGSGTVTTNSMVAPSVSPTGSDDLLICAWASGGSDLTAVTAPAGMTGTGPTTDFVTLYSAYQALAASGATGTRATSSTLPDTRPYCALSIAVKGAAAAATSAPPISPYRARRHLLVR